MGHYGSEMEGDERPVRDGQHRYYDHGGQSGGSLSILEDTSLGKPVRIPERLEQLGKSLDQLEDRLNILYIQLEPITTPAMEQKDPGMDVNRSVSQPQSTISQNLDSRLSRLGAIINGIDELLNRLEL